MALRNLSQSSLITLTRYYTDPLREQLLGYPTLAWAPAVLDAILDDLVALEDDPRAQAAAARAEATAADGRFDNLARTLYYLCKAYEALALAEGDTERAGRAIMLGRTLLPDGLHVVKWSYLEEAAEADRIEGRLNDDDRALMGGLQVFGTTLLALVAEWQAAARELGEADRRRTDIEADVAQNRLPQMNRVRGRWMDTIRAMRAAAALLAPSEVENLFRKLNEAEARADARVAARRAAGAAAADVDEVLPLDGADVRAGEDAAADAPAEAAPAEVAPAEAAPAEQPAAPVERPAEQPAAPIPGPLAGNANVNLPIFVPGDERG